MDANQLTEIRTLLDTPLVSLTPRQIITGVMFLEDATDEDLDAVGLPAAVKDL